VVVCDSLGRKKQKLAILPISFISNSEYNDRTGVNTMAVTREPLAEYVLPSVEEAHEARESSRRLSPLIRRNHPLIVRVLDDDGQEQETTIRLPERVARLLLDMLVHIAEGNAVTVIPTRAELTTQQAADLINVSRPFLVQLLESGEIPFRRVGTHRRVLLSDVLAYKERSDAARKRSLDELTALSQKLGLEYC